MQARVRYLIYLARSSFWFLPGVMLVGSVTLSLITVRADRSDFGKIVRKSDWLFRLNEEGGRLVLSTIAGSMITVTSLVFSLTLVALTLASRQFGPRLLTMFMRDRANQLVLGTFLATFVYSLTVLGTMGSSNNSIYVPNISIFTSFIMSLICFSLLIYFIHHVSEEIQADSIIAAVGKELDAEIDKQIPLDSDGATSGGPTPAGFPRPHKNECHEIHNQKCGYVQTIDFEALTGFCARHDVRLELTIKPGDFLVEGQRIGLAWPRDHAGERFDNDARLTIVAGPKRTPADDIGFRFHAIVEIALRALSPGINDTRTAIACVDRLAASLARLMSRGEPTPYVRDGQGEARVVRHLRSCEEIFDISFDEIRQFSHDHLAVILRQISSLAVLASLARTEAHFAVIRKHGGILKRLSAECIREPLDQEAVKLQIERLRTTLDSHTPGEHPQSQQAK